MIRIPLGTYSIEQGKEIQRQYNKSRQHKERDKNRIRSHILLRGRGKRGLYEKVVDNHGTIRYRLTSDGQGLPLKYAQRVAVYLIINPKERDLK